MNVVEYRLRKRKLEQDALSRLRLLCSRCLQPEFACYCARIRSFDPQMKFIILIHPLEARRRIATGRMSHLCLQNSLLARGEDYSSCQALNAVLEDPSCDCVVLYPGPGSTDLESCTHDQRAALAPAGRKLAVIVIDGTWRTARKMVRSQNIVALPRVCFTPRAPSRFRVRKQPAPECWSTIEAIHQTIELLGPSRGFDVGARAHDNLLKVFDHMVERQLAYVREVGASRHSKKSPSSAASVVDVEILGGLGASL